MKRQTKKGITTGNTIRYVGNQQYSTMGKFLFKWSTIEVKTHKLKYCQRCGGSKFSCKGGFYDMNQYSKTNWKPRGKKHIKSQFND